MSQFSVEVRGMAVPAGVVTPEVNQPDALVIPAGQEEAGAEARCAETTAAGEPCKNAPGDDGLCGVHRRKGASDATAEPADQDADQGEEGEEGEEASSEKEGTQGKTP